MPIFKLTTLMFALMFAIRPGAAGAQNTALTQSTAAMQITSPLTVFYGETIDGLAQVTASDGSAVTGTVTFYDGTGSFCVLTLTNGASCPTAASLGFDAGTHVFTAAYSGDATHAAANSNAVTVMVNQDSTATTIVSSASPVAAGVNVIYTTQVQGAHGMAVGTVEFFDGAGSVGSAALDGNGRAALSVVMVAPGVHTITAKYRGTANSAGSTSAALNETVNGAAPGDGFSLALSQVTVNAGGTAVIPVKPSMEASFTKAMTATCTGLPDEASCIYVAGAVKITTSGPRHCGTTSPYGATGLPMTGAMLAGLFVILVPRRQNAWKGLLTMVCGVVLGSISGCGTGNCTDLGSRPGTYTVAVGLSGVTGVQKVTLVVKP